MSGKGVGNQFVLKVVDYRYFLIVSSLRVTSLFSCSHLCKRSVAQSAGTSLHRLVVQLWLHVQQYLKKNQIKTFDCLPSVSFKIRMWPFPPSLTLGRGVGVGVLPSQNCSIFFFFFWLGSYICTFHSWDDLCGLNPGKPERAQLGFPLATFPWFLSRTAKKSTGHVKLFSNLSHSCTYLRMVCAWSWDKRMMISVVVSLCFGC